MSPFVHPCVQKQPDMSAIAGSLTTIPGKIKLDLRDRIALSHYIYISLKTWYVLQKDEPEKPDLVKILNQRICGEKDHKKYFLNNEDLRKSQGELN